MVTLPKDTWITTQDHERVDSEIILGVERLDGKLNLISICTVVKQTVGCYHPRRSGINDAQLSPQIPEKI